MDDTQRQEIERKIDELKQRKARLEEELEQRRQRREAKVEELTLRAQRRGISGRVNRRPGKKFWTSSKILGMSLAIVIICGGGAAVFYNHYKHDVEQAKMQEAMASATNEASEAVTRARTAYSKAYQSPSEETYKAIFPLMKEAQTKIGEALGHGTTPRLTIIIERFENIKEDVDAFDLETQIVEARKREEQAARVEAARKAELEKRRKAQEERLRQQREQERKLRTEGFLVYPGTYTVGVHAGIPNPGRYTVAPANYDDSFNFIVRPQRGFLKVNTVLGGKYGDKQYNFNLERGDVVKTGKARFYLTD